MRNRLFIAALGVASFCVAFSFVIRTQAAQRGKASRSALIGRGKYIVDGVAMCGDCHTPRLPTGAADASQYLRGADLEFKPVREILQWAERAPDITAEGLKEYSVESLIKVLKGKTDQKGQPMPIFKPPMPPYRLKDDDAKAVAMYLKSLKPK
jgi:mono/diheme cytochrome c family protein